MKTKGLNSRAAGALLGAMILFLAACGSSSKSSNGSDTSTSGVAKRPNVTFDAADYSFSGPSTVPAGYVDITLHNGGKEDHQAAIAKVDATTTIAEVQALVAGNDPLKNPDITFVGGPNNASAGQTVTATVHLTPGRYAMMCFIPAADGKAHAVHGMVKFFTVTDQQNTAPEPQASATATLNDFNFALPTPFPGTGTLKVVNGGSEVHEMIMSKLLPGKTLADARTFYVGGAQGKNPGPPPFTAVGGVVGVGPGQANWIDLHLTPGTYVFFCFFPDPKKGGLPHALEGMLTQATVS
jgi:hypothetical protein